MNIIGNKMFAYIDNHSELTQSMVNQYNDSLIFLGDEKQIFVPLINAYVGIGQTAYENLLSRIGDSNNNLNEYDKYIHNDTVTSIYAQFSPTELEIARNDTNNVNHRITVRGISIDEEITSYTIFKANKNVVLKGFNDYGLVDGKDELGRVVNTSYTSGINVSITHASNIRTGKYSFNGIEYSYTYYDPYDIITIDDTKTWSYIKSSNSYMIDFVTKFSSEQANRVYKNILGIADNNGNVYIEKEFDEAFNYSDYTKELTVFKDVYVKMSNGIYKPVTVENEQDSNGGFVIKVKDLNNIDQIIYADNSTQTVLNNNQLKQLLAGQGNDGIYGGYIERNGEVIPVWYHKDTSTTGSSYINLVDGIQTLREVAYILDQITDGTSDDGINLAYNISSNYIEIQELKKWAAQIGNETVSSFKSESGTDLLTVNYYSTNLWDKDRDADGASIGKIKLDLDLRLAQTYELNGVTYAAYLTNHDVPDQYKTYFIFTGDDTDKNNYILLDGTNHNNVRDLLGKQDPSLVGNSTIKLYRFIYDKTDNTKIIGKEQTGSVTLNDINNSNSSIINQYIYFPYTLVNYDFSKGLTDVKWVTTYVSYVNSYLNNRINNLDVSGQIDSMINTLNYNDSDQTSQGLFVTYVTESAGIINVHKKKLPLDTILKNDVYYTNDIFLHISTADALTAPYSSALYKIDNNGNYVSISSSSLDSSIAFYEDLYYKTSLANMSSVPGLYDVNGIANTNPAASVEDMILNSGNVTYFYKKVNSNNYTEYLPLDIQKAYTEGTLFDNDVVKDDNTIYYWIGTPGQIKYFDVSTIQRNDGSTTTLFTSYITYLASASSTNSGLADAWDVRRTIESMFQWVNIKTNKIIS